MREPRGLTLPGACGKVNAPDHARRIVLRDCEQTRCQLLQVAPGEPLTRAVSLDPTGSADYVSRSVPPGLRSWHRFHSRATTRRNSTARSLREQLMGKPTYRPRNKRRIRTHGF